MFKFLLYFPKASVTVFSIDPFILAYAIEILQLYTTQYLFRLLIYIKKNVLRSETIRKSVLEVDKKNRILIFLCYSSRDLWQ